ncbi:hypothetical protein [Enterovibrio norvegicus]|uniref:hypothetical protein n=1 Tax=Enterovibrio norvegicus TaxID=188144 RepID=UPI0024B231BE|nr:hypothetical protein [Enterovibrio norvegicus]
MPKKSKKKEILSREITVSHKSKTLHYRYAELVNYDGHLSFSELLHKALVSLCLVKSRYQIVNEDSHDPDEEDYKKSKLFINNKECQWGIVFGDLMRYAEGANKSTVTIDDDREFLEVESLAPPETDEGKRREFLDSILYFGAFNNHLAIIQSASLRTSELEKHINWLLRSSGVIEDRVFVRLTMKVPELAQRKLENSNTKVLKIGAPLVDTIGEEAVEDVRQKIGSDIEHFDAKSVSVKPKGKGLNWLLSVFGDMEKLKEFGISEELLSTDAIDGSSINVSLEISYKRKSTRRSQEIINNVSKALRHQHPNDITIELDKVGKLVGRELSLQKKLTLRYVNGVLDPQDLYPKVREWLVEQISVEELDANS